MRKSLGISWKKKLEVSEMGEKRGEGEDVRERLVVTDKEMEKDNILLGVFFTLLAFR